MTSQILQSEVFVKRDVDAQLMKQGNISQEPARIMFNSRGGPCLLLQMFERMMFWMNEEEVG